MASYDVSGEANGGGGGGSSLPDPVTIAHGGTGMTTANAGLNALQALTLAQNSTLALLDNVTNTAPVTVVYKHTSSGTTAAGFGFGLAVDLQSAAGNVRRVETDITTLITATDGAETTERAFSNMTAGALQTTLTLGNVVGIPAVRIGTGTAYLFSNSATLGVFSSTTCWQASNTVITHSVPTSMTDRLTVSPLATASGVLTKLSLTPAADTGTTASTEAFDVNYDLSRTRTWATGALTTQRAVRIKPPTYAFVGASTITNAATVAIEGAPIAGTNATLTNAYSLWVQAGTVRLDLADAATTTAPDGLVQRHTTSGTSAAGYGITNATELVSAAGNLRRVMTDVTKLTVATDTIETASRAVSLMINGSLTAMGGWASLSGLPTTPGVYVGDPASGNGMARYATGILFQVNATNYLQIDQSIGLVLPFRIAQNRGAGIAAATTITLGTGGNTFPVSAGTGTINSIVATNWQAGSRIVLECASGITITHNVSGTGATILTNTGSSIVTSFTRMIPLTYNGTNWIVEG